MIVMVASASLNVAIPALARDLGASASSLEQSQALATTGLAGALQLAGSLPEATGAAVAGAARAAFVDGFGVATLTAAAVLLLASVAALVVLPRQAPAAPPTVSSATAAAGPGPGRG